MRIRLALPEGRHGLRDAEKKEVLDAALEATTRAMVPLVKRMRVPTAKDAIRAGRVRWKPEPPGDEHFDLAPLVMRRGWGDCDDLAPWHAASLRATGTDKGARAVVRKSGPHRWHAVVRRSDGSIEDPSKAAGMGRGVNGPLINPYVGEPVWPGMFRGDAVDLRKPRVRLAQAVHPVRHGFAGRVDVPDQSLPWAWSGVHVATTPERALAGALDGCLRVAGQGDVATRDALVCGVTRDLLAGHDPRHIVAALEQLGVPDSVGFLGDIAKGISSVAKIAAPIVSVVNPAAGAAIGFGGMALGKLTDKPASGAHPLMQRVAALARTYQARGKPGKAKAIAKMGLAVKKREGKKRKRRRKNRELCFQHVRFR